MRILVTGGAGYIGSHVVLKLHELDHEVVAYDNLSTGHRWAVLGGELVVGDVGDGHKLTEVIRKHDIEAVMHFAASIVVPESVHDPLKYYGNNTVNTLGLLKACAERSVRYFIFSSTAAVYGMPEGGTVHEDMPLAPIHPYGASKMMSEHMLMDLARVSGLRYIILRYFNVAGADPQGRIGQATPEATHLIKVACETALGKREALTVFGTDYPTPDGTCIRDYIHVEDLAQAHVDALAHLSRGGEPVVLNCGYGHGYSVLEVLEVVKRVVGVKFPVLIGQRRAGDSAVLIAANDRIRNALGWRARFDDLEVIVKTALAWEEKPGPLGLTGKALG